MSDIQPSGISQEKATELANLILIAYDKNKIYINCLEDKTEEPPMLFPSSLSCNSNPTFDETCPNHQAGNHYEVITWLWHTDRPFGMVDVLRALPFGFIAANHSMKELYIVIRGTITSDEWQNNLITKPCATISGAANLGVVHEGFNNIFCLDYHDRLREYKSFLTKIGKTAGIYHDPPLERQSSIKDLVHEKVINSDWIQKGYKIFITGHSLGGALSMLAGFLLLTHDSSGYKPILSICTFGAPRVGNPDFGEWFKGADVVRYVNTEDTVPTVPPPTSKIFGSDMNEFNNDKVRAQRQMGYETISRQFGATQGVMEEDTKSGDAEAIKRAFVHIGKTRAFTLNKGSISYNHNLSQTYRAGIAALPIFLTSAV